MTAARRSPAATDEVVELVDGDPAAWASRFTAVHTLLRQLLGPGALIEHIGSTAVPGLPAKDVVDVLVGVQLPTIDQTGDVLAASGFVVEGRRDGHVWLSLRSEGRKEALVHVVEAQGRRWERRLAFRDLLRRDLQAREEYLTAKRAAAEAHSSWDAYGTAKANTVQRLLASSKTSEHSCTPSPCESAPRTPLRATISPGSPSQG